MFYFVFFWLLKFEWINKIFIIWSSSPSLFFLVLTHNIYNWISFLFLLCYMYVIVMIVSWLEGSCKYNQRYNSHIHDDDEDHVSIDDGINKWIFNPKKKNKIAASVDWELKKLLKKKFFKYHHQYDWSLLKKIHKIHCVCVCVRVCHMMGTNERTKKIFGDNKFCFLVIKIVVWWRWSRWKKNPPPTLDRYVNLFF